MWEFIERSKDINTNNVDLLTDGVGIKYIWPRYRNNWSRVV